MEASVIGCHVVYSVLGAIAYHVICLLGKWRTGKLDEYSISKGARVGVAVVIQIALCVGMGWIPADGMNANDLVLIGLGAASGIDNGLKIAGWKA
jgi:hypothetical protein